MAGGDDLVDEGGPVVRPLLLQDGDEDQVEFVEKGAFGAKLLLRAGVLDDEIHDEIADACAGEFSVAARTGFTEAVYLGIDPVAGPSIES